MNIVTIIKKRLLPLLIALAMLFGISIVAIAAGGGGGGNAGPQDVMAGTGFQLRLSDPDTTMSTNGGTYALEGEYDPTQDIVLTFSLNPNGGQKGFGIYPAKDGAAAGFDGVIIYDKSDSAKTPVLSLGGNYSADTINSDFFFEEIEDSGYPDHLVFKMAENASFSNERSSALTIKANKLEGGKTYCLYLPSTIKTYNNGSPKQLGAEVTIEFTTKASGKAVQSWVTGDCTATLYDDGTFVVEANEGGTGLTADYSVDVFPPWLEEPYASQIKKVVVKEGVKSIGSVFCALTSELASVSFPDSLTRIGDFAFAYATKLQAVVIPAGVKEWGEMSFAGCSSLTSAVFSEGLTSIGTMAFSECSSLANIILPEGLKTIANAAFDSCSLKEVTIPESVTDIASMAFNHNPLSDIFLYAKADGINVSQDICQNNSPQTTIHVYCDQVNAYNAKKIRKVSIVGDIHTASDSVKENEVSATCTKDGSYDEVVYCSECKTELSREKKTVDKLSHTEEVVKGKAATCTEAGLTDGKKCSVCGEILEEQKEIPALGHDYEVIPEVISTCTEKGSTAGVRCTKCGEYLLEPKEVPMIRHDYQNGKCTVCGAEDPDYKPTPVEPDTKANGVVKGPKGWAYYKDGEVVTSFTGFQKNQDGWWRIENGYVNFDANSIYRGEDGKWFKTTEGKVTWEETGFYKNEYGWWYVVNSQVDFKANSVYKSQHGGWFKTTKNKVTWNENGLFSNQYGTWKVEKSKVDFGFNGTYQGKTIKNGKVQ